MGKHNNRFNGDAPVAIYHKTRSLHDTLVGVVRTTTLVPLPVYHHIHADKHAAKAAYCQENVPTLVISLAMQVLVRHVVIWDQLRLASAARRRQRDVASTLITKGDSAAERYVEMLCHAASTLANENVTKDFAVPARSA